MCPALARTLRVPALVLLTALVACGGDEKPLPPLTWTWVPIDGNVCGDGSSTGIGIEPGPGASPDVLVFLDGGGACWDGLSCYTFQTAGPGRYGAADFDAEVRALPVGSIFDRAAPGNPYKDFTFVFVPYCTGDVHAGDRQQDYAGAGGKRWFHKGRVNLTNAIAYLATTLDAPAKIVLSGASAGGFGALLAFDKAKAAWPSAKGYLVDDSGPPMDQIPDLTVGIWYEAWGLAPAIDEVCGSACSVSNLSALIPALAARHPSDRFALLSSTADQTMRNFFLDLTMFETMPAGTFEAGVRELAGEIEDDLPPGETHAFVIEGTSHTMLGNPAAYTSEGVGLFEWLRQQVEDDPAWSAAIVPP